MKRETEEKGNAEKKIVKKKGKGHLFIQRREREKGTRRRRKRRGWGGGRGKEGTNLRNIERKE